MAASSMDGAVLAEIWEKAPVATTPSSSCRATDEVPTVAQACKAAAGTGTGGVGVARDNETILVTDATCVFQKATAVTCAGEAGSSRGNVTDPVAAVVSLACRAVAVALVTYVDYGVTTGVSLACTCSTATGTGVGGPGQQKTEGKV